MAASLIQHGAIRTTEAKAKELRRYIERLITIARQGSLHARRRVIAALGDRAIVNSDGEDEGKTIVQKLFDDVAPMYADRAGGYTRIIRLDERRIGDAGTQVILQLVEEGSGGSASQSGRSGRRRKRAVKRHEAARSTEGSAPGKPDRAEAPADQAQKTDDVHAGDEKDESGPDDQAEASEDQAEKTGKADKAE